MPRKQFEDDITSIKELIYINKYNEFNAWWKTLSNEDKTQYLQSLQERMADRYGMPRRLVVIDDIVGGLSIGGAIVIDVDDLNATPWRVIELMFHETRHEYQREVVANFQDNRVIPDGMTKQQVERWVDNYTDYKKPDDNFRDYYYQAIERDAREFGEDVMKDFLSEMGQGGSGGGW